MSMTDTETRTNGTSKAAPKRQARKPKNPPKYVRLFPIVGDGLVAGEDASVYVASRDENKDVAILATATVTVDGVSVTIGLDKSALRSLGL